jgi:hypothetical protein
MMPRRAAAAVRPSGRSVAAGAVVAGLYALALWLRLQILHSPPYGDEGLHYWVARHFAALPANVTDVDGLLWFHPFWLVWQRPAYYLALHPFALHGFTAFRLGHALLCALLPVVACGMLRAWGVSRVASGAAGLFAAAYPPFVAWGGLALMDEPMAVAFAAALWALRRQRHLLSAALFVVAVWTKESAFIGLAGLLAAALFVGWVVGRNRLDPLRLDRPTASLLLAAGLAPLPLVVSLVKGLNGIGNGSPAYAAPLADAMWATPWLLLVLLWGLRFPTSRALCALALGLGLAMILLNGVAHRTVEAWYLVQPAFFAACAAAAALDAAVRAPWAAAPATERRRRAVPVAAALVLVLLAGAVLLPASAAKAAVLHPFARRSSDSLPESIRYENQARDRDLVAALAAIPGGEKVVAVDMPYPIVLHLAQGASHVYVDSSAMRLFVKSYTPARFAATAESPGTVLLVGKGSLPFIGALDEAYGACRVLDVGSYRVYESWRCPGGGEVLERQHQSASAG